MDTDIHKKANELRERMQASRREALRRWTDSKRTGLFIIDVPQNVSVERNSVFKATFSKSKYDMKLLRRMMNQKGYEVVLFANGEVVRVDEL